MLIKRIEPFQYFAYLILWWSYIIFIDVLIAMRTERFLILTRNLPLSDYYLIGFLVPIRDHQSQA
ncbi:MAG: hypothetical protein AB7Y74_03920 [Syntrophorhabdus sp.]